jgi:hypothetical protein
MDSEGRGSGDTDEWYRSMSCHVSMVLLIVGNNPAIYPVLVGYRFHMHLPLRRSLSVVQGPDYVVTFDRLHWC